MRVVVVEDDALIARGIAAGLRAHAMTVDPVPNAAQARAALASGGIDAVVLDLGLPDEDGMSLLRSLRGQGEQTPILLLTARDSVGERIEGLHGGADDYLTKPFDIGELAARLHALARRAAGRPVNVIERDGLRLDPSSGDLTLHGEQITLSRRETALLAALLEAQGRCLTAAQLEDRLYGFDSSVESNAVTVHVHNLRRKLGAQVVETVRGLGYRFGRVDA